MYRKGEFGLKKIVFKIDKNDMLISTTNCLSIGGVLALRNLVFLE